MRQSRGNIEEGFRISDHVFEDRYTTTLVHNAQMEPRSAVAAWDGDKLTVYTPTGGIARASLKTALIARVSAPSLSLVPVPWALT